MNIFINITCEITYSLHINDFTLLKQLKIHNNVVDNMNNSKVTALTLQDISAAFDTIHHSVLLQHLNRYFGIYGTAI